MGINDFIYYYDFAKIYRWFKRTCRDEIVPEDSFEKTYQDDIVSLLLCIVEHTDFSKFLKEYNRYRLRYLATGKDRCYDYVLKSGLVELVGEYVNKNNKHYLRNKVCYTCYLLDGILFNMRNWKP